MRLIKFFKAMSITAATIGILLPLPTIANAAENATINRQAQVARDLALGAGGVLRGQVVNKDGLPEREATVSLMQNGEIVANVTTNNVGEFAIAGVPSGVCAITSGKASGVVRAWSHGTAPPAASKAVLLVPSDLTVRGKGKVGGNACGPLAKVGVGGLLVLGMAGAIVAIAVNQNDAS